MEDDGIMELLFARSEQAIAELTRKYDRVCRRIAGHILNSAEDAEECVNDTWLAVWNNIPPATPDSLAAYVCKIARNQSLKKYRYNTAKRRNSFYDESLSELEECIPAQTGNTDSCTEEDLTVLIEDFLDSLDHKSRILFLKRYWYAEPVSSIAEEFRMTENHVSVRMCRIRAKLRTYLEKKGVSL